MKPRRVTIILVRYGDATTFGFEIEVGGKIVHRDKRWSPNKCDADKWAREWVEEQSK